VRRPFYVVLDGWRLSVVGGSFVILTVTTIAAVVTR
jgi:hypothetical protein